MTSHADRTTGTSPASRQRRQQDERLWPLVREALGGSRRDLTAMPLSRAIVLLAVPMVLEMVMESVFAVADIFWVSKLGADAVAAVGLTESLLTIVYAVGMGLAMGVGAVVARRIGAKDHEGAARAAVQAIFIGLGLAAVLGVVGGLFAPTLLAAMGASPAVMAIGAGYARLMLGGDVTVLLLFLINAALPRRGRRRHHHARALAGERDQHPARPAVRVRPGAVPAARRHRRGGGDHHRPQHRRALPAAGAGARQGAAAGRGARSCASIARRCGRSSGWPRTASCRR